MSVFSLQPSCHSLATDEARDDLWETGEKQRIHERNGEEQKFLNHISLELSQQRMAHQTLHGAICVTIHLQCPRAIKYVRQKASHFVISFL